MVGTPPGLPSTKYDSHTRNEPGKLRVRWDGTETGESLVLKRERTVGAERIRLPADILYRS